MGDRILKVNDTDVSRATHQDAVLELLKPGNEIKLTIQHDPLPAGFQVNFFSFLFLTLFLYLYGFYTFYLLFKFLL